MGDLASRIMQEFDTGCQRPSIVVYSDTLLDTGAVVGQRLGNASDSNDVIVQERVELTNMSYPNTNHGVVCMGQLVTCLLFGGYLTMDAQGGVQIPNGELRQQWEELRLAFMFQSADISVQQNMRAIIVNQLCRGDISSLCTHFKGVLQHLSKGSSNNSELQSAGLFRVHVLGCLFASSLAQYVPFADRPSLMDLTDSEDHNESGRYDWKLYIPRICGTRLANGIHVLAEFKQLERRDTMNREQQLRHARRGLEQIVSKGYATRLTGGSMRLDIGIAIGQCSFCARQRLWDHQSNNALSLDRPRNVDWSGYEESSDLTVVQWDKQLADADDQGWSDGLGRKTKDIED
ncbi:hypothetical protein H4R24_004921 [Coemansia sp. RSA 988]|nr:hypothetical protein H4R24_004921 [Coemansia sp. RSA 988]